MKKEPLYDLTLNQAAQGLFFLMVLDLHRYVVSPPYDGAKVAYTEAITDEVNGFALLGSKRSGHIADRGNDAVRGDADLFLLFGDDDDSVSRNLFCRCFQIDRNLLPGEELS